MSYDLAVYSPRAVSPADLRALILDSGLDVDAGGVGGFSVVRGARRRHSFTIDGPDRTDDEDVPDHVGRVVLGVRYLYSIMVEGTVAIEVPHAVRFARRLAATLDGAVLDQQSDEVWSRSRTRAIARPQRNSRVATVDLEWYCLRQNLPDDPARVFATTVERCLPEALPRRFGEYEPLQGTYSESGVDGFAAAWAAATTTLYSTGSPPCVGGHLDAGPSASGRDRFWSASLTFLADPIAQPGWHAALRRLFVSLADAVSAFYATGEVTRGHIWTGRSLCADDTTEWSIRPLRTRHGWLGLPPQPIWWTWFGRPYREFRNLLPAERLAATDSGVLYEAAARPTPADQLQPMSQLLPATLFAKPAPNPDHQQPVPLRRATEIPTSLT